MYVMVQGALMHRSELLLSRIGVCLLAVSLAGCRLDLRESDASSESRSGSGSQVHGEARAMGNAASKGAAGSSVAAGAPRMTEDQFEGTDSGWTIVGDAEAISVKPELVGSCGHDGGCISAKDSVTGGTWFYQAPSSYLGDHSAAYGEVLEYDLMTTVSSSPFEEFDVVLSGNGQVVAYDAAPTPVANIWTTYRIRLTETSGWRLLDSENQAWSKDFANATRPTQAQFKAILGALTRLRIRGEFQNGADSGSLDNVKLGVPQ